MDLRAELLRAEQHEAEIPAAFSEIEQHFPDISLLAVVRGVLVQLVDEHDDVIDAEVALLEVFPKLGDDAREDQILRGLLERGDVDYIHRSVLKAPERQGPDRAVVSHETRASGRDVREPIPYLADGRHVMGAPAVGVL